MISEAKLKKLAKGQRCTVWLPGCLHDSETVVLAHIRRAGTGGIAIKPPSLCGLYACLHCHSVIDGREHLPNLSRLELDQYILYGLLRTLCLVDKAMRNA